MIFLAGYEFEMKGTVFKSNGNQITIKDDRGKETTVEGEQNCIKVGSRIILYGQILRTLTAKNIFTREEWNGAPGTFLDRVAPLISA